MKIAHNRIDETGNCYGKLTVIQYEKKNGKKAIWRCLCDCGNITFVSGGDLRRKDTKAISMCLRCGQGSNYKHGHNVNTYELKRSITYKTWRSVLNRKRHVGYVNIEICEEWTNFANFLQDMGERPSINHSIDRVENSKGYYKGNCKWSTMKEQSRNKTTNVNIEINGKTNILFDWLTILKIPSATYYARIKRGLTPYEALTAESYIRTKEHNINLSKSIKYILSDDQKTDIQNINKKGASFAYLARQYKVSNSTIARICGRKY